MASDEPSVSLLALPDPLLLAVLQCCADDQRSLFSAARAHSRLHQAAVLALSSVSLQKISQQQQVDGVLQYLSKHGQRVRSISLEGDLMRNIAVHWLPPHLELNSLHFSHLHLQLQPGNGGQCVLGVGGVTALKQLRLSRCVLLDGDEGLAAALSTAAAALEHLSLYDVYLGHEHLQHSMDPEGYYYTNAQRAGLPARVLQQMQQLTHLELFGVELGGPDDSSPTHQALQALTRLVDLRLAASGAEGDDITASLLSGMHCLTRLEAFSYRVEAGALAGKAQLQHLRLKCCSITPDCTALLAQLQDLQQLTHLDVATIFAFFEPSIPAEAYSALTASSKLQFLNLWDSTLPRGVWEHLFPAGRQLPHLASLHIPSVCQPPSEPDAFGRMMCGFAAVPEGSRLVSCCPGLKHLDMLGLQYNAELLAPLTGLSGLHTLRIDADEDTDSAGQGLGVVWQLTGLRELDLFARRCPEGLLMQIAQLKQLTKLTYNGQHKGEDTKLVLVAQAPGDKPVWRQVLMRHLRHRNPAIVQQAIRALAE